MTGRIFEIREFTLHDGPGVRTTVFMKGCPLRCAWCHNPEGQRFERETMTRLDGSTVSCGTDWEPAALAKELLTNADIMRETEGGVTFSGGEPLAQADFLAETIPLLKAGGVAVAIETSGHVPQADYRRIVGMMDFVYQDLKHHDAEEFRHWTGGDLGLVLSNIAWLRSSGVPYKLRVPLIPSVNDGAEDREAMAALVGDAPVEYLPYNAAAGAKYRMLGRTFPMEN